MRLDEIKDDVIMNKEMRTKDRIGVFQHWENLYI